MGFFNRDKNTRAAEDRKPSDNPAQSLAEVKAFASKSNGLINRENVSFAADKYKNHPVVYRCLDKIGGAVQAVSWYAEKIPGGPMVTKSTIDSVESVLRSPNSSMSGAQLRYWLAMNLALFSRAPMKFGMINGDPNAIYPLMSGKVKAKSDKYGNITEYEYGDAQGADKMPSWYAAEKTAAGTAKASFGAEIYKPSVTGKIEEAMSPLGALGVPAQIVSMLFSRAWDVAEGQPNLRKIIGLVGTPDQAVFDAFTEDLQESRTGGDNSGKYMTLAGVEAKVTDLDQDMSDLHTKIPLDDMSRHIAGIFGIPIAMLGFAGADGSKFANNYTESRRSFFEDTMIPGYLIPIQEEMTRYLCPRGLRIRFDLDTIPALQDTRIMNAKNLQTVTFLDDDEKRELIGFGPRVIKGNANAS